MLFDVDIDPEILAQTEAIEFYSYSGAKATDGISGGTTTEPTDPEESEEPELTEEQKQILATAEKLLEQAVPLAGENSKLKSANMKVLDSIGEFDIGDRSKAIEYVKSAVQDLRSVESQVNSLVSICAEDPHYTEVKVIAERIVASYNKILAYCEKASADGSDARTNAMSANNEFVFLVKDLSSMLQEANQVLVDADLSNQSKF